MSSKSRMLARGARLPSVFTHSTRLRTASRRITCFIDSGSQDQELAKQTMSRRSSRMALLDRWQGARRTACADQLTMPELERQQRPQLLGTVLAAAVSRDQRSDRREIEAFTRERIAGEQRIDQQLREW